MRLLHSTFLELRDFQSYEGISYAILSHTWAEEEVLFQEIDGFNAASIPTQIKQKLGYRKIQACCAQAKSDGFDYVWIDTCCIDKRSSAELSEAINSMYRWYQDCSVCYAYLADVPNDASPDIQIQKFRDSRWFTRGWTLQELIGPLNLEFYGNQWYSKGQSASLGTKRSLQDQINLITGIPQFGLLSSSNEQPNYSIAQKMSWAAKRSTTRIEDRAYSLMGLFNVNMPLLYGEGDRAFVRLQEEIMKVSTDESLFAWKIPIDDPRSLSRQGLLATSLDYFADSGSIIRKTHTSRDIPFTATNKGLHFEMTLAPAFDIEETRAIEDPVGYLHEAYVPLLNCADKVSGKIVGILLYNINAEREYFRMYPDELLYILQPHDQYLSGCRTTIFARLARTYDPEAVNKEARKRHFSQERKRGLLVLREAPSEFRIVRARESEEWTKSVDDFWVLKTNYQPLQKGPRFAGLLFDDGADSFIVALQFDLKPPQLKVFQPSRDNEQADLNESFRYTFRSKFARSDLSPFKGTSDRATCILGSKRVVSASFRPEHWRGNPCYALRVCVCNPSE